VVEQEVDYPLPPHPASVDATGEFNYPNSNGFQYEAAAVQRCISKGLAECPQYTADESLVVARIMEEVRTQLGVKPVDEE
jgi:dihydrodiol dehydrogenase / D-xylose 1-dehydrogenase (NADP)